MTTVTSGQVLDVGASWYDSGSKVTVSGTILVSGATTIAYMSGVPPTLGRVDPSPLMIADP